MRKDTKLMEFSDRKKESPFTKLNFELVLNQKKRKIKKVGKKKMKKKKHRKMREKVLKNEREKKIYQKLDKYYFLNKKLYFEIVYSVIQNH